MARTITEIQAFLASPSDVTEERKIVSDVIAELNRTIAPDLGLLIRLIRWEDMIPSIERRAQQVVLEQVELDNTDLFIGILWNRFGSPTGHADSGTEEEFKLAYESWLQHRKPRIMMYFCQRSSNLVKIDELEQKLRVLKLREEISTKGIFHEFNTPQELEATIRNHITRHLLNLSELFKDRMTQSSGMGSNATNEKNHNSNSSIKPPEGMIKIQAGEFLSGSWSVVSSS